MESIYNYNLEDFENFFLANQQKKYRAKQVFQWLYQHKVISFGKMSNVAKDSLALLEDNFRFDTLELVEKQVSDDKTIKYLFQLNDGNMIEAVLMRYDYGNSVCVSSQVGCNLGCAFCASGQLKKVKNLEVGEMVAQIMAIQADLAHDDERVSHVVVMGIGEPFDNYNHVMKFVRIINNPFGLAIGARHITISTCGLIDGIEKYQTEQLQTNLAISLHSALDDTRSSLMPVNNKYNLSDLRKAIANYIEQTNRRVTFEYILLKDINDSKEDALALIQFVRGLNAYVNIIPYNKTDHTDFKPVSRNQAYAFSQYLKQANINVTIRKEHGRDIDAACGQLRSNNVKDVR